MTPAEFETAYETLLPGVRAYFYPWFPNEYEDLASEVFLKLWRVRDVYEERGTLAPYVYHMARNIRIDRSRKLRPTATLARVDPPCSWAERDLRRVEDADLLCHLLAGAGAKHRHALNRWACGYREDYCATRNAKAWLKRHPVESSAVG